MSEKLQPQDMVRLYLRAQNLEQMLRTDEAVVLYEEAVAGGFDAAGPYDRLIAIYLGRGSHADVRRIAGRAVENVRTFEDKRNWYEQTRDAAEDAVRTQPDARGAEF